MGNKIFDNLLIEQFEVFKRAFSASKELFINPETGSLIHPGEYGTYRESICKEFLRFFIPSRLEIDTGFILNIFNENSTQCDIIVYDRNSTPLLQSKEKQRFFPAETLCAIGEIKSTLNKHQLKIALNKLAYTKKICEAIDSQPIKRKEQGPYHPDYIFDQKFTFLICEKIELGKTETMEGLAKELPSLYDSKYEDRHKHNLILSLQDGVFLYFKENIEASIPWPKMEGKVLPDSFIQDTEGNYASLRAFATYMFMATSSASIYHPELTLYMLGVAKGLTRAKRNNLT